MTIHDAHRKAAIRAKVDELLARDRYRHYAQKFTPQAAREIAEEAAELHAKIRDKRLGANLLTSHADGER